MKNRRYSIFHIAASLLLSVPAHAISFWWDGTTSTVNADGGNGTWDTTASNLWDNAATNGAAVAWPSTGTDNDAVFGGTAGTVTIATGGVTANDLTFSTTGYTVGGAGLTLNGTLPVINVTGTATINSSITTSVVGGFSKTGTGTLILGGANTFAAGTTLAYGSSAGSLGAIRLAHGSALSGITVINGVPASLASLQAQIQLSNNITVTGTEGRVGGRANSQTTGAFLVNISGDNTWAGAVRIFSTGGGHGIRSDADTLTISGAVNSNIGARTWEIGGAGNVTITGAVTTAVAITKFGAGTLTLSSSGNTYTGDTRSAAGSLVINHANALSGSALDLATADTGTVSFGPTITAATFGSLKGSRNLSLVNTAGSPAAVTLSVGANNVATNTYTGQLSGSGHLYKTGTGIQILDPGSAASITIGSLSANGGNLILKSGTFANSAKDPGAGLSAYNIGAGARLGTLTIDGATLNVGGGNSLKIAATASGSLSILSGTVTSADMVIGHNGAGTAIQSGGFATVTNLYHQDGGTGSSYTLSGTGDLTARRIFNNAATGDFTLNLDGGTLRSASVTTNLIDTQGAGAQISVLLGAGNTVIDTTASNASIVRPVGDMPAVAGTFTKAGGNTLTLTGANTYTGGTTVNQGTLTVSGSGTLGATTGRLTVSNTNTGAGTNTVLNLSTSADSTVGSLSGTIAPAGTGTNTATINNGGTGRNFTVNQTTAGTYAGVIAGAGNFTLGSLSTNTLTLTGSNTYSGTTTLSAGTLLANNTAGSATGAGAVTVNGGTLGGTGTLSGAVAINTTGVLSPGASVGTLGTGALSLNTGSTFFYELNTTAVTGDVLNANGALSFEGTVTLSLTDLGSNSLVALGSKFTLISYFGAWDGETFSGFADNSEFTSLGNQWRIDYDGISAGSVNGGAYTNAVTLTVIPEPGSALLGGLGLLVLLRRRR